MMTGRRFMFDGHYYYYGVRLDAGPEYSFLSLFLFLVMSLMISGIFLWSGRARHLPIYLHIHTYLVLRTLVRPVRSFCISNAYFVLDTSIRPVLVHLIHGLLCL